MQHAPAEILESQTRKRSARAAAHDFDGHRDCANCTYRSLKLVPQHLHPVSSTIGKARPTRHSCRVVVFSLVKESTPGKLALPSLTQARARLTFGNGGGKGRSTGSDCQIPINL